MAKQPSPLAAALADIPTARNACPFAVMLDDLNPDDQAAVSGAVDAILHYRRTNGARANGGPNVRWLHQQLTAHGVQVSRSAVDNHIGGRCSCGNA